MTSESNGGVGSAVIRPIDHAPDVMYLGAVIENENKTMNEGYPQAPSRGGADFAWLEDV